MQGNPLGLQEFWEDADRRGGVGMNLREYLPHVDGLRAAAL
jgi:hypothetical protein